jgi:hypothetical protein
VDFFDLRPCNRPFFPLRVFVGEEEGEEFGKGELEEREVRVAVERRDSGEAKMG